MLIHIHVFDRVDCFVNSTCEDEVFEFARLVGEFLVHGLVNWVKAEDLRVAGTVACIRFAVQLQSAEFLHPNMVRSFQLEIQKVAHTIYTRTGEVNNQKKEVDPTHKSVVSEAHPEVEDKVHR